MMIGVGWEVGDWVDMDNDGSRVAMGIHLEIVSLVCLWLAGEVACSFWVSVVVVAGCVCVSVCV